MGTENPSPVPLPEITHPYAIRVSLQFGSNVELDLSEDEYDFRSLMPLQSES
jgi:hypothetical protein